jgi:hypothetical protein
MREAAHPAADPRIGAAAHPNYIVRRLGLSDIPDIQDVERRALPDTLSARFGRAFSALYYRTLMADPRFFCIGCEATEHGQTRLVGFLTYSPNVPALLRDTLRRHVLRYLAVLAVGILAQPSRVRPILQIARGLFARADPESVNSELLTIALLHEARGPRGPSGERVSASHELTQSACDHLAALGATRVMVMCKPAEPIANKFVQNEGFRPAGEARRFGEFARRYVKNLQPPGESA